jgi:hypothetical protein
MFLTSLCITNLTVDLSTKNFLYTLSLRKIYYVKTRKVSTYKVYKLYVQVTAFVSCLLGDNFFGNVFVVFFFSLFLN